MISAVNKHHIVLFLLIAWLSIGCADNSDKTKTLRLAHNLDIHHPVHQAVVHMKETLENLSSGSMTIQLYPSGQLGSEREVLELIQIGSLAMTKVSASSLEAFVPEMQVFSVPYLFSSPEHFWRVLTSDVGEELLLAGQPYYFMGLGYYDAGSRSFYTRNTPILRPEDLAGLKIRVMNSQSAVNMVNTLGGSATPVSWGELYTALQQGVVDGAENNPPSFYSSKHYEVAKHFVLDEHTSIPDVLVLSTRVWGNLSEQEQTWLKQAASASVEHQRALWKIATKDALAAVRDAGVNVMTTDKAPFSTKTRELRDQYAAFPSLMSLIERIEAMETPDE